MSTHEQDRRKIDGEGVGDAERVSEATISRSSNFGDLEKDCQSSESLEAIDNNVDGIAMQMKRIKLRQMELEIKREELKLEQDKMYAHVANEKEILSLESEKVRADFQLSYYKTQQERYWQDLFDEKKSRRRQERLYFLFRMLVCLLLVIAGIWLLSRGDSLGAYLLGTGAGSIGLYSASSMYSSNVQGNGKEDKERIDTNKTLPMLNGGS